MGVIDFVIKTDKDVNEIAALIFFRLFYERIQANKPCIVIITGASGEGKSYTCLKIIEEMYKLLKIDITPFVKHFVVMNPLQYSEKLNAILYEKFLRKIKVLQIDEARAVVGSDKWASFVNQTIAHVNAMSRAIKPLMVFIITQSIKDVDNATRRTINYEIKCTRRRYKPVEAEIYKYWIDDHNPENPVLRKRKVYGIIKQHGENIKVQPRFIMKKASPEVLRIYEGLMIEGKTELLNNKLTKLTDEMKKDIEVGTFTRVEELHRFFLANPDNLKDWAEYKRKKWKIVPDKAKMLNLTKPQVQELERRLVEGVVKNGIQ